MPTLPITLLFVFGMLPMLSFSADGTSDAAASRAFLLVANKADRTLGMVDPEMGSQVATVAENEVTGHEVAASPDGRAAYVPIYGDSGVGKPGSNGSKLLVVDVMTRKLIGSVDFGHGVRPHCPIFDRTSGLLYVTTELDNSVTIIDPRTLKIEGSIPTGKPESHMLTISHDGKRGFTANVGSGTVSVLDLKARKLLKVIPVSGQIQRISISPDDLTVFTADQTKPQIAVIDTAKNEVKSWISLPAPGYGTAVTPDGRYLLVAMPGINQVAVVELASNKVSRTISVPATPQAILIRPDGKFAYASCDASHKVAAIRISDWTVEKLIDAGNGADGLAWAAGK